MGSAVPHILAEEEWFLWRVDFCFEGTSYEHYGTFFCFAADLLSSSTQATTIVFFLDIRKTSTRKKYSFSYFLLSFYFKMLKILCRSSIQRLSHVSYFCHTKSLSLRVDINISNVQSDILRHHSAYKNQYSIYWIICLCQIKDDKIKYIVFSIF